MPNGTISNISPISFTTRYSPALSQLDNNEESHRNSKPDEAYRYKCILVTHVKPRGDPISLQEYASKCHAEVNVSTYNSERKGILHSRKLIFSMTVKSDELARLREQG
jgi:hypothetical protein